MDGDGSRKYPVVVEVTRKYGGGMDPVGDDPGSGNGRTDRLEEASGWKRSAGGGREEVGTSVEAEDGSESEAGAAWPDLAAPSPAFIRFHVPAAGNAAQQLAAAAASNGWWAMATMVDGLAGDVRWE